MAPRSYFPSNFDDQQLIVASSASDRVWVPGGTFRMGSDRHYPEEAPSHFAHVDGFWIDRTPVTNREFRRFVDATGHVTFAEIAPDPKDYPGALPEMLHPASLVFTPPGRPVDLRDFRELVGVPARRQLAPALWAREARSRTGRPSRSPCRLQRRRGLRRLGRQGAADRSGMGVRCARRARCRGVRVGRRVHARRAAMANTWQGEFPNENLKIGWLRADLAGRGFPAERIRNPRHDRQRLGMDPRLVSAPGTSARFAEAVLRSEESARRPERAASTRGSPRSESRARY